MHVINTIEMSVIVHNVKPWLQRFILRLLREGSLIMKMLKILIVNITSVRFVTQGRRMNEAV